MKNTRSLHLYFFLFLIIFALNGCTKLAGDFDSNSSVEEILLSAEKAMGKKDYTRAAEIFLKVDEFYPYSDDSRIALIKAIRSYHAGSKFSELRKTSKRFLTLYPNNQNSSFAKYMIGMSYFDQIIDVERDQGATRDSIREFSELIDLYPKSEYSIRAKENIIIAKSQLAGQEMAVGRYYLKRNNPLSAINRFKTVIEEHKNTPYYPEAIYRSMEAYSMLGVNNKVLSYAKKMNKEFPKSEWATLSVALIEKYGFRVE